MARTKYKVHSEAHPHFLTCTFVNWLPLMNDPAIREMVIDDLSYQITRERLSLHAYILMPDHFHLIATSRSLSRAIGQMKSYTAKSMVDHYRRLDPGVLIPLRQLKQHYKKDQTHQIWQEGFHPQAIEGDMTFAQKLEYIHTNPVKRGLVLQPGNWPYSSYQDYLGKPGPLRITPPMEMGSQAGAWEPGVVSPFEPTLCDRRRVRL